jgi:hypothetical protein
MSELTGRPDRAKGQAKDPSGPSAASSSGADGPPSAAESTAEPADLSALAEVSADDAVVRRTKDGWRVGDVDVPDLTSAMVLADIISAELAAPEATAPAASAHAASMSGGASSAPTAGGGAEANAASTGSEAGAQATATAATATTSGATVAGDVGGTAGDGTARSGMAQGDAAQSDAAQGSPAQKGKGKAKVKSGRSKDPSASETSRLRMTIGQLEHALTARIRVEQAIGVLAERHRIQPRQAFEQLRSAARNRGRRVIDIASDVVASATNPLLQLPDELSRPRSGGRQQRRNRQTPTILGSE